MRSDIAEEALRLFGSLYDIETDRLGNRNSRLKAADDCDSSAPSP